MQINMLTLSTSKMKEIIQTQNRNSWHRPETNVIRDVSTIVVNLIMTKRRNNGVFKPA